MTLKRKFWLEDDISPTEFMQLLQDSKIGDLTPEETKLMFNHKYYKQQDERKNIIFTYEHLEAAFKAGYNFINFTFEDWFNQRFK